MRVKQLKKTIYAKKDAFGTLTFVLLVSKLFIYENCFSSQLNSEIH